MRPKQGQDARRRPYGKGRRARPEWMLLFCLAAVVGGCGQFRHKDGAAAAGGKTPVADPALSLHDGTLAMLTPTAAPAHEEDRQGLAQVFYDTLRKERPDLKTIALGKTLSAINSAGLAGPYDQMYVAYKNTGLIDGQTLHQIAQAVGARYLVELKLGSFDQENTSGFSLLGVSLGHKATADLRLTLQIWDGSDGQVVWERSTEQSDTKRSFIVTRRVKMEDIEKTAAEKLIKQLPR
jgi:hypothetical protein